MNTRNGFAQQIPTPQLDPLLMGEVMGSDAFSEGDWVLLRTGENKPVKITSCHQDLIFVDQGMGENFEDSLVHFYPEELGYPLDHRFWSLYQKRSYLRCHFDRKLLERWVGTSNVLVDITNAFKAFLLGVMVSVFALMILGFWSYHKVSGRLSDVINRSSSQ